MDHSDFVLGEDWPTPSEEKARGGPILAVFARVGCLRYAGMSHLITTSTSDLNARVNVAFKGVVLHDGPSLIRRILDDIRYS